MTESYTFIPTKEPRSDDFVDGLQVAYKAVYKLKERNPSLVRALDAALVEIDQEITKAVDDNKVTFILP